VQVVSEIQISCCQWRLRLADRQSTSICHFHLTYLLTYKSHTSTPLNKSTCYLYCVNCGASVGQCRDLFFGRTRCCFSSSRGWTVAIWHSPAFHHISCHGCSQW